MPGFFNYSWGFCKGGAGMDTDDAARARTCHLENVCWDMKSRSFMYFKDPDGVDMPFMYAHDKYGGLDAFKTGVFSSTPRKFVKFKPQRVLATRGAIPAAPAAVWSPVRYSAFIRNYTDGNYGHTIGDLAYGSFWMQAIFGYAHPQTQVVMDMAEPEWMGTTRASKPAAEILLPSVTHRRVLDVAHPAAVLPQFVPGKTRFVCFENIFVGNGDLYFDRGRDLHGQAGTGPMLLAYRDFVLSNNGLDPLSTPQRHAVVLFHKQSKRRKPHKFPEMLKKLQASFPSVDFRVLRHKDTSHKEQLEAISSSTVFMAYNGGGSFGALFLPRGASSIFADCSSATESMRFEYEHVLWTNSPHIRDFYYPVHPKDVINPARGSKSWKKWCRRQINLDPCRMARLMKRALYASSRSLGLPMPRDTLLDTCGAAGARQPWK